MRQQCVASGLAVLIARWSSTQRAAARTTAAVAASARRIGARAKSASVETIAALVRRASSASSAADLVATDMVDPTCPRNCSGQGVCQYGRCASSSMPCIFLIAVWQMFLRTWLRRRGLQRADRLLRQQHLLGPRRLRVRPVLLPPGLSRPAVRTRRLRQRLPPEARALLDGPMFLPAGLCGRRLLGGAQVPDLDRAHVLRTRRLRARHLRVRSRLQRIGLLQP